MILTLIHASERFDRMAGKILKFLFNDPDCNHYKAEILEGSPEFSRWYNLLLSWIKSEKEGQKVLISNILLNHAMVVEESLFKVEITDMTFVPRIVSDEPREINRKDWQ